MHFQKVKNIKKWVREIFLSEWYFMCKVRLKRAIDMEAWFSGKGYANQIEACR
jgi:hypothetical protein